MPAFAAPGSHGGPAIRLALLASILVHLLVFSIPKREREPDPTPMAAQGPLTVRLEPLGAPEPPASEPEPTPARPVQRPQRVPLAMPPRVLPDSAPVPAVPPPVAEATRPPDPTPLREPAFDMSALIAANRERRRAREAELARGTVAPGGVPESGSAGLARNLASLSRGDDTGGIFSILRVGPRTAEFAFNGWTAETRRKWRQVIEVDAGPGGDIQRAIVRRMIALIREHYSGDFRWESPRAGRVVVLSAAPENSEELEEYLLREFFGTPVTKR